jgi:transposase
METLIKRCCGLDVHQATVVACLRIALPGKKVSREICSFATTTAGLLELRDWLTAAGCTHVGMESTGVYWRPVHAILEDAFTVIVGNAQRIKNVPGRKTDVKDAEWLAELLALGLIWPSFVPDRGLRALSDLVRFRRSLVEGPHRLPQSHPWRSWHGTSMTSERRRAARSSVASPRPERSCPPSGTSKC